MPRPSTTSAARPSAAAARLIPAGIAIVATLTALVAWLAWLSYQSHDDDQRRVLLLEVGRQTAINLTTIDWTQADIDVQRILGSATGHFHDEFSQHSQEFIDTLKQAQAKSTGTISDSGIESATDRGAQVLVAIEVRTSNAGAPEQAPRYWRMRL
jgi:Mce-associated membrane protein